MDTYEKIVEMRKICDALNFIKFWEKIGDEQMTEFWKNEYQNLVASGISD